MKIKITGIFLMIMTLGALIYPGSLFAEEEFDVYTLGEIVVTAERSGVRDVSINAEVSAEDLLATNSRTVAEAMQHVSGIQVTMGRKMEYNISLHGFSQDKILILIDGVPYYETYYGKLDPNQILTENVARIDVVKGAASVLYGANAEAGVINVITKKATEKPSFSGSLEIGEKDGASLSLSHGQKKGNMNYWLSFMHREWDAQKLSDDFEPRLGQIQTGYGRSATREYEFIEDGGYFRNNSDYKTDNLFFKVGVEPSKDSEYYLNLHYIATEKGYPPDLDSIRIYPDPPAYSMFARMDKYDDWGADLSGRKEITDKFGLMGKLFYHNHEDTYVSYSDQTYETPMALSTYKDKLIGSMVIGDYHISDLNIIKLALNYRKDVHEQNDDTYLPFEEMSSYTGSVGLEDEFILLDSSLSVVAGVSYDWFEVDKATENTTDRSGAFTGQVDSAIPGKKSEINPMIGANYDLNDRTRFFASVAKKTRFPTLKELYTSKGGNVNLEAEKSINYTVGVSRIINEILSVEFSPFYHDISDRITRDLPDPDEDNPYRNAAKIRVKGIELNASINPSENVSVNFGFTYNDAEDASPGQVTDKVTGVPEHVLNTRLQYTVPGIESRINLTMINNGKSYDQLPTFYYPDEEIIENDSYTVLGIKITQPFMEKWESYLSVNNILDKNYEPESGFPAQGRNFWLGFSFKY